MNYKIIITIFFSAFLFGCNQDININTKNNDIKLTKRYNNLGFALIYNDNLKKIKKLEPRSLNIYHKSLKRKSKVKITNPENGKYLIAEVKSNKIKFSNFYNSVLSLRISKKLELDLKEPYVELIMMPENSTYVAKKRKCLKKKKR